MSVNLIPIIRNLNIVTRTFTSGECEFQEGCVQPGARKLLRFDALLHNPGTTDLVIGNPAASPHLFEFSSCHNHYHLKEFTAYRLLNFADRSEVLGRKQAFCLMDIERIDSNAPATPKYHCGNQGIQHGWADVYSAGIPCQWIDITGVPDGDYVLEVGVNVSRIIAESYSGDNTAWKGVRISGSSVTEIPLTIVPEDCIGFNPTDAAVQRIGGRWKVIVGSMWLLDFGSSESNARKALQIIKQYGFTNQCFVGRPGSAAQRPMQYYLVRGKAPSGAFAGEDCIGFNPAKIEVKKVGTRWKIVEGTHWILDFGGSEANARAAFTILQKYQFRRICFVGRPNPPMAYFRQ